MQELSILRCNGFEPGQVLLGDLGTADFLFVKPASKHFVKFRAHKVDKYHAEDDTPFPLQTEHLEGVVGNLGDVKYRKDRKRKCECTPEKKLVVHEIHLKDTLLQMLAFERVNHQNDGKSCKGRSSAVIDCESEGQQASDNTLIL